MIYIMYYLLIVSFGLSRSMRSVPNSPPLLPSSAPPPLPPLQDNLDLFPPLPSAYPASYMNTPPQQQQQHHHQQQQRHHQQLQQQQYAHDDEAISYSNRLRKGMDFLSTQQQHYEYEEFPNRERQGSNQSLPPFPSPIPPVTTEAYRPRSASVSRKPLPLHSATTVTAAPPTAAATETTSPLLGRACTNTLAISSAAASTHRPPVNGIMGGNASRMGLSRSQSGVHTHADICVHDDDDTDNNESSLFKIEATNNSSVLAINTQPPRLRHNTSSEDSSKKTLNNLTFLRSVSDSDDCEMTSTQVESAYIPPSYAAYAQSMFNYGGISGIPTPLTREILSFVERVDDFGAKMQKYVPCYS